MTSPAELQAIREPVKRYALIDLVMATHIGGEAYVRAADFDAQSDEVRRLREAQESLRKNIEQGLLTALRNCGQLDMDGCEVRVSRQACEEAADHLEQFAALGSQP